LNLGYLVDVEEVSEREREGERETSVLFNALNMEALTPQSMAQCGSSI